MMTKIRVTGEERGREGGREERDKFEFNMSIFIPSFPLIRAQFL